MSTGSAVILATIPKILSVISNAKHVPRRPLDGYVPVVSTKTKLDIDFASFVVVQRLAPM